MGRVEHLHIARSNGAPMEAVRAIEVIKEVGVVGDRHAIPPGEWDESHVGEELTLVEAEALEKMARDHDIHLEPGETRRTVTTRGIALNDLVGRSFRVGEVEAVAVQLCEPCQHLRSLLGKPILQPLAHRAGIRVQVIKGGTIRVGDSVEPVAAAVVQG